MARSVSQLKEQARRAEQREKWSRAIELYLEALEISEESGDISLDLSLYNRIGDLYRRGGDTDEAVRFYRKAVEQYADEGLHTGAVALCNKILRLAPDQVDTYRILGRLHASSGLAAEARNAFRQYAERMEERGDRAAAQDGLLELARCVEDTDLLSEVVEEMVASGRDEDARSALREIWEDQRERAGDPDPGIRDLAARLGVVEAAAGASDEGAAAPDVPGPPAGQEGAGDDGAPEERPDPEAAEGGASTPEPDDAGVSPGEASADPEEGDEASGEDAEGVELDEILLHDPGGAGRTASGAGDAAEAHDEKDPGADDEEGDGAGAPEAAAPDAEEDDGPPPVPEGPDEAATGEAGPAAGPDTADGPSPAPEADEPVDLGERIRRRLGGGRGGPADDAAAQRDFDDMLVGFRAEAAETSGEADPEAHVELGVALLQMGLVDDAVREFQVAARAPDPPVRAFELLGECFLEKGLHSVAVRVLNRALRLPGHPDHELLGVLYQLGVAYQSVEEHAEALDCFERVFSVDIDFRDVGERMEEVRARV